jgi:hydroxypyruvate reductase
MVSIHPSRLLTTTLRENPWGDRVARILSAALEAVEPSSAVNQHVTRKGSLLYIGEKEYDLETYAQVYVVGAGKAGAPMSSAIAGILGDKLTNGIVIVKEGHAPPGQIESPINILEAGHPIPDERGLRGTELILGLLEAATVDELVICLLSGGGSALLTAPVQGMSLDDFSRLTSTLLASGATINEINCIRKHLSQIKGGKLALAASPATLVSLILSDVVGDPLDVIASGPTVPDTTTFGDALDIISSYSLEENIPPSINTHLQRGARGEVPETPKPGDPIFDKLHNQIIASNRQAAFAARAQAEAEGFNALVLTTFLQGEAKQTGPILASILRQIASSGDPIPRPACLIAGGETTVTLRGDGLGGRNQELALSAVGELAGLEDVCLVTLASDGGDGPTDAAGAVVTGNSLARGKSLGLSTMKSLADNDSYHYFSPLGDLIITGPTMTNVNDLVFIFAL